MKPIVIDSYLVSMCGLYCGACGKFRSGKCMGCQANQKATWCKARTCCMEKGRGSCAECRTYDDPGAQCKALNNKIAQIYSVLFNSDRGEGLRHIKAYGKLGYAREMAIEGRPAPRRKKRK